jgi:hypothetical protein
VLCTHRHPDGKVVLLARTTGNGLISRILQLLRKLCGILEQFVVSASWGASMHGQCHGLQVSSAERVRAVFAARPFACNPVPPFPTLCVIHASDVAKPTFIICKRIHWDTKPRLAHD